MATSNFAQLKKSSNIEALQRKITQESKGNFSEDKRFWTLATDKAGNGVAVIRFLPSPNGEDFPWIKYFEHAFKGPGGWYIEKCGTSFGLPCPICEANTELWNTGLEANKNIVNKRKRKARFISNIYVVKDNANPENEGQVRLFRYGKKIFEKIQAALNPKFEDQRPIDPFDFWKGADFRLRQCLYEGYPNYDNSTFDNPSEFFGGNDEQLEKIWNAQYPLLPIFEEYHKGVDYNENAKRFKRVINTPSATQRERDASAAAAAAGFDDPAESRFHTMTANSPQNSPPFDTSDQTEDDLDLDYFRKLAED